MKGDTSEIGQVGARFPSAAQLRRWEDEERRRSGRATPAPEQGESPSDSTIEPEPVEPAPVGPLVAAVRPYVLTGGRTKARYYLGVETLVSAQGHAAGRSVLANPAHQAILELCARPTSVAEVAALMTVPLGVARVLVGDLAHAGALFVHRPPTTDGIPDLRMMERVLHGLHRL